jgi:hypothetical protein
MTLSGFSLAVTTDVPTKYAKSFLQLIELSIIPNATTYFLDA